MSRLVYFLLLIVCVLRTEGQSEGDACDARGSKGVCKSISDCPAALQDIRKKIYPNICSFTNTVPIICCLEAVAAEATTAIVSSVATTTPTTTTTTTPKPSVATTNPPNKITTTTEYTPEYSDYVEVKQSAGCAPLNANMTAPKTGQKAWDKCVEYQEQYVFPCQDSVALTGGKVRGNNCKHNANKLVINGIDAGEAEFPHMALLGFGEKSNIIFQCGGSIVSENFILTAGHCTFARDYGPVTFALVGALRRSDQFDKDNLYGVYKIFKNPGYAPPSKYNDIALLETDRRIKLNAFVVPACLDTGHQPVEEAVATGWGALVNGSIANVLQKVKIYKYSEAECSRRIPPSRLMRKGIDSRTQMCFGDTEQSKDTCQILDALKKFDTRVGHYPRYVYVLELRGHAPGIAVGEIRAVVDKRVRQNCINVEWLPRGDSGGPLQVNSARITCMHVVTGVTSFGRKCGVLGEPGVYTRVLEYLPWIESTVWPS